MQDTSDEAPYTSDKSLLSRLRLAVSKPYFRWSRGMTLGARVAVIDRQDRVLLVKHTYAPGWILPGGGVERGESCLAAAEREVWEEAAVRPKGPFELHGVFSNHADFPGDHLVVYVLRHFEQETFKASMEIADARFFARGQLPDTVTAGSRRRIAEILDGAPVSAFW
jgi:8-oxo-dGTP pyrophosphatase MutT (NUDIX family)